MHVDRRARQMAMQNRWATRPERRVASRSARTKLKLAAAIKMSNMWFTPDPFLANSMKESTQPHTATVPRAATGASAFPGRIRFQNDVSAGLDSLLAIFFRYNGNVATNVQAK